jgi:hypothetical protein
MERTKGMDATRTDGHHGLTMSRFPKQPRKARKPRKNLKRWKSAERERLRIDLEGQLTRAELMQQMVAMADKLADHGVTNFMGVSVYLKPCDKKGGRVFPMNGSDVLESLTIPPPYRSMADEKGIT